METKTPDTRWIVYTEAAQLLISDEAKRKLEDALTQEAKIVYLTGLAGEEIIITCNQKFTFCETSDKIMRASILGNIEGQHHQNKMRDEVYLEFQKSINPIPDNSLIPDGPSSASTPEAGESVLH